MERLGHAIPLRHTRDTVPVCKYRHRASFAPRRYRNFLIHIITHHPYHRHRCSSRTRRGRLPATARKRVLPRDGPARAGHDGVHAHRELQAHLGGKPPPARPPAQPPRGLVRLGLSEHTGRHRAGRGTD